MDGKRRLKSIQMFLISILGEFHAYIWCIVHIFCTQKRVEILQKLIIQNYSKKKLPRVCGKLLEPQKTQFDFPSFIILGVLSTRPRQLANVFKFYPSSSASSIAGPFLCCGLVTLDVVDFSEFAIFDGVKISH